MRFPRRHLFSVWFLLAIEAKAQGVSVGGQRSPQRRVADSLLAAKKYAAAESAFVQLTITEPNRAGHWLQLGMAANGMQRFEQAAMAFEKANAIQRNPTAQYNAAAMHARAGKVDLAFGWLDSATTTAAVTPEQIEQDPDFEKLRADPRFSLVLDRARHAVTPCMYNPDFRRLDFWIGAWDVRTLGGGQAGQSVVEPVAGGCALLENWNPSLGRPGGKSLSAYNARTKQWQQFWVGGGGGIAEYSKGTWTDTSVAFISDITGRNGEPVQARLTFTKLPDGRVRQHAEQSINGGAWTTQYDFYYVRRR